MRNHSKSKIRFAGILLMSLAALISAGFAAADDVAEPSGSRTSDVVGLDILTGAQGTRVEIATRGAVSHRAFRMSNPSRYVVDVMGAIFRADTSPREVDGSLVQRVRCSQYKLHPSPISRIVVELDESADAMVEYYGGGIAVMVSPAGTLRPVADETARSRPEADFPAEILPVYEGGGLASDLPMDAWQTGGNEAQVAQPVRREDDAAYARTFSVNAQNADVRTIVRSIADFSGVNIITSPRVAGQVTVALTDVPWREALDVILRAHGFGYVEEHGVLRIDTLEKLREEEIAQKTATQRVDQIEQLVTQIVAIDFANADEIKDAVEGMISTRGSVEVEPRTNSLIVNDIPGIVEAVATLVRDLDSKTPQVHINALLVDLDTRVSSELGVDWGVFNVKPEDLNVAGDLIVSNPITDIAGQVRVGTVQDWGDVRAAIQALENDNRATIISNPRITTTDNREAEILVGQKIPLIVADEAGNAVTQLTTIGIRLIVTPHINSDRQITLDVHPEVSDLSSQATVQGGVIINTSEADTRVLVNNNETAVIGGLIRNVQSTLTAGVPVLKDIPLLGALFRSESKTDNQRELVVFITPTIVDTENRQLTEREQQLLDHSDSITNNPEYRGLE